PSGPNYTFNGVGNLVGSSSSPIDPRLLPLMANGGPTLTHALLLNSPARDAGSNSPALTTDQRGQPRIYGSAADIGAFELGPQPLVLAASASNVSTTGVNSSTINVTFADFLGSQSIDLTTLATGNLSVRGPGGF